MSQTVTTSGFTNEALEELARRDGETLSAPLRRDAFERFEAMPLPSAETEEWRYTDLTELDLGAYSPARKSRRRPRSTSVQARGARRPPATSATGPASPSSTTRP